MDPLDIKELVQAIKEGNREAVPSREQLREKAKVLVESKKNIAQIREEVRKRKELAKGNTEATKIVNHKVTPHYWAIRRDASFFFNQRLLHFRRNNP